jgi:PPP family 3-phenylpropionic acid transporter
MQAQASPKRFATRLALFYGTQFGLIGTHLPFFPMWLKAVGIDASWIGIITAVPAVTMLPVVTGFAERRNALRGTMVLTAFAVALGFFTIGTQHQPLLVFIAYVAIACMWTPMVPLTDAYALRGVARYGLNYGPLRLWGSIAFVVGALVCGLLVDLIAPRHLIWVIAAMAGLGALASLTLQRLDARSTAAAQPVRTGALLGDPGFLAVILAAALIQGSHAAYYTFASISWQGEGLGGLTIAGLWVLGVVAEIAVFALSPRFTLQPSLLVVIGGVSAVVRWLITAQEPSLAVLSLVQLAHGFTYGLTQVGTMGLLVRHVPLSSMATAQGYLAACSGIVTSIASILCGAAYAQYGQRVYLGMAAMAAVGSVVMWLARRRVANHPHNSALGG